MSRQRRLLRVAFVGAGGVNFGGAEGPWDHASRVERLADLVSLVVGVCDTDLGRARSAISARRGPLWSRCRAFSSLSDMLRDSRPDAVFIGLPPVAHGGVSSPLDVELVCASFGVSVFVEKPLSVAPPEEVLRVLVPAIERSGVVAGVGYMMRHLKAVSKMKEILEKRGNSVHAVHARYNAAYEGISKRFWWDLEKSGGPIVEQATHFVDLARYFAGDALCDTVRAVCVSAGDERLGRLSRMPEDVATKRNVEEGVPECRRIPRATTAVWKFKGGAVGSLAHAALLHGKRYESEIEVWADGLMMRLVDPYDKCRLIVRDGSSENSVEYSFRVDDPYHSEDRAFLQTVASGSGASGLLSSYSDAAKTYELTWAIRRAAECASSLPLPRL